MQNHEIDYKIHGEELQCVEVELDPQETAIAESGSFMMMDEAIEMTTIFGDGSGQDKGFMGKLFSRLKHIDDDEKPQPDHVNEVPVPSRCLESEMMLVVKMAAHWANKNNCKHDCADSDVKAVKASEHEKRRTKNTASEFQV